jgi:hypothetical protein
MCNGRQWEGAFVANGNRAVRTEVAKEQEIAAMAVTDPEVVAEPGMGSVRQIKCHCDIGISRRGD